MRKITSLPAKQPNVSIILLNWNGVEDTIECLQSLRSLVYENFNVVVCDNYSTDGSIEKLQAWLKLNNLSATLAEYKLGAFEEISCASEGGGLGVRPIAIIQTGSNFGFAGGNNVGLKYAMAVGADFFLLLNNDTVVEPTFLTHLIEPAQMYPNVGLVGGRIQYYDKGIRNRVWFGPARLSLIKGIATADCKGNGQFESGEVTFITGCMMLISREVVENVGYLSDAYFMNVEDWEYCYRVQQFGYKLHYSDKALIYHKVGASSGGELSPFVLFHTYKNRIHFLSGLPWFYQITGGLFLTGSAVIRSVKYLATGKVKNAAAITRGVISGLTS